MSKWEKLIASDFFKGFVMMIPSFFFGGFSFTTVLGMTKMMEGGVKTLTPEERGRIESVKHAQSKAELHQLVGTQDTLVEDLQSVAKRPAGINQGTLHELFNSLQESNIENPPAINIANMFNPNPTIALESELYTKFSSIYSKDLSAAQTIGIESITVSETEAAETISAYKGEEVDAKLSSLNIGDEYEGLLSHFDKEKIEYIYSKLFDPKGDHDRPQGIEEQLIYHSELVMQAREFLRTLTYNGLDIIMSDNAINNDILEILVAKHEEGQEFSKLERIIADLASYMMGGIAPSKTFEDLIIEQLQHYSRTGQRLYGNKEIARLVGMRTADVKSRSIEFIKETFHSNP